MGFETFLRLIKEKDLVRAGTVNTPMQQVDQNVRYLWDVLQAAAIGSTVYARRQTVEAVAKPGMAVWFNTVTQQFERGLANAEVDPSGVIVTAGSAQVWGVIAEKLNTTLADILLFGVDTVDLTQAVDGPVLPGTYYLSGSNPGKLVRQKPPISVAVLRVVPDGRVFVMPQFIDVLDRHTHYRFSLHCAPAGHTTPPAPGHKHVITSPDATLPGWLPAGHASFNGNAPPGAVLGYNLATHPSLKNAWPPVPFNNAYLEWDKGLDPAIGFTGVPVNGHDPLCVLDRNGLWWMSDCYGDVPWPHDLDTVHPTSESFSAFDQCPRVMEMQMQVWFTKVNFSTDQTMVLSLHSGDRRVKVNCFGTSTPASTGHLQISLDLNLTVKDDQAGYLALKQFDPTNSEFLRGPVVEGFYGLSPNVSLTGDVVGTRTIASVARQIYQGLVGISVQPRDTLELEVQLVRLDGAEEEFYQDFMYLGFLQGEQRQYRAKIQIPSDLTLPSPHLKLRFHILGRLGGTLPQLLFSARRLPRPSGGPADLPLSAAEFAVTCNTNVLINSNNQYVEVDSESFAVSPGDSVFFTVQRSATDGYGAEVGILRQVGVIVSGS